ncbi:hypothetical protein NV379_04360 [Paenibacillus sp. N1-5-1-14]|uniref:hypothetical protein n=1 Tax=Paenibacillus radicibacter TaxID=2972488 RepID=UPI002158CBCD|nr:hypothetical protein [Paenibacillus radicibacter]MCR8641882.1 hypothetical protein [Paenibacillus radicibacter]
MVMQIITALIFVIMVIGVPHLIGKLPVAPIQKIALVACFFVILVILGYQLLQIEWLFFSMVISSVIEASIRYWKQQGRIQTPQPDELPSE